MASGVVVAVVGVTGAVGQTTLKILEERKFPVRALRAFASARSAGKTVTFKGETVRVEAVGPDSFKGVDIALFSAGSAQSKEYAPFAVKAGAIVVDKSNAFRMDPHVPLVVPEINPHVVKGHRGILACPNCTTIVTVMPLKPLHEAGRLRRVVATSYQAVSGAGVNGVEELRSQTLAWARGEAMVPRFFQHQIAFNVIPHVDKFGDNGYTGEEMKLVHEVRKILELPDLPVSPTTVRVPCSPPTRWRSTRRPSARPVASGRARSSRDSPGSSSGTSPPRTATRCRCWWKARTTATWAASARTSPSRTRSTSGWWATSSARAPRSTASRSRSC